MGKHQDELTVQRLKWTFLELSLHALTLLDSGKRSNSTSIFL
jgi:hypothetical protein